MSSASESLSVFSDVERTPLLECRVRDDERVSTAVLRAVSHLPVDGDALADRPLHEAIDVDCLDALFSRRPDGSVRHGGVVAFSKWGWEFLLTPDAVRVYRPS